MQRLGATNACELGHRGRIRLKRFAFAVSLFLALFCASHAATRAAEPAKPSSDCGGPNLICGLDAPEDLVPVDHGAGIIASSLDNGGLYLIDTKTHHVSKLDISAMPERVDRAYPCASLHSSGAFVTHGLSVKPNVDGHDRLYAVRHGGREAIEVFEFARAQDVKSLQWIGCVMLPKGFAANAVVGRKDGGFYVTSMTDPGNAPGKTKLAKLYAGEPSGAVLEWSAASGFRNFAVGSISGPNGIELSPDESKLYLAAWASREVLAFDLNGHAPVQHVKVDFMPDNLRWADDGRLFAAGVQSTPGATMTCAMKAAPNVRCATHWMAAAIDARTMRVVSTESRNETSGFGDVSTALKIGPVLWLGAFGGDSVAIRPIENAPR